MSEKIPQRDDASTQTASAGDHAREECVPQSLETFKIDVAAGNSAKLANSAPPSQSVSHAPASVEPASAPAGVPEGILVGQTEQEADPVEQAIANPISIKQTEHDAQSGQVVRRVARESSWWLSSFGLHVILLAVLAFTTLAIQREEELELYTTPAVYEPIEEFEDLEIDPSEDFDSLDEELSEPDPAPIEELLSETLIEDPAISESTVSESVTDEISTDLSELSDLFGESGAGLTGMDSAVGEGIGGGMARFFGTEVKAKRILYMLDNSGGMRKDGKFEALVSELKKSISALDSKQEFYVIFYSDTVYPLFYPQGVRKFVRPNDRNLKLLERWLTSVELCVGNAIDEALAAAEVIRPEAVFLLTDGDLFTTERKKALLLNPSGRNYTIHTFGLGVGENTKTAAGLKEVAEANSGTFRAIQVTPEMEALAKETQRPYHNREPGLVWGLKVGSR